MTLEELNSIVDSDDIYEFIRVCEARQRKAISRIADDIARRPGIRLVLLAGGSSAGKTTTAKRLCTQLRVNDMTAIQFSTDDYFVGDSRNPKDENGEFDYETIECVDRERLSKDLNAIFSGEEIYARRFDFIVHEGFDDDKITWLPKDGVIVLEGLHALNPALTSLVDDALKYSVYVDPITQPEIFATTRLPSTVARLMRRIVRDNQFRKMDPAETFRLWPKVLEGEKKWILPFRDRANALFDSSLPYELSVLKPYLSGLIERFLCQNRDEPQAIAISNLLKAVHALDPTKVPGDSILRETIGGSQYDY